ncbi:MAG: hypothetical protein DRI98_04830 [Bacteroidetes bacterium]|nr:MAG: hypothetical protein DRI98_04830 [Bacteroidota bacterium]
MCTEQKPGSPLLRIWIMFFCIFATITSLAQSGTTMISSWSFDAEDGRHSFDDIQQKKDSIYGSFEYVPGVSGNAIKLDGFRTFIKRDRYDLSNLKSAFTVEAWIALASYPWSWAPVVDCSYERLKGFFFGIGPEGHVGFKTAAGNTWHELITDISIPLREWTHVAAVFEAGNKITVFINGAESASVEITGNFVPQWDGSLTIGRNKEPQTWHEPQFTTDSAYFFLDGILDEIRISGTSKTVEEISTGLASVKELPVPALSHRDFLPKGPAGSGSFGAFYTRLNYYKEWDDLWRVSEVPDLFVRFEQSPVQLVFWRGTSFNPCWVTENDIWYTNEWLETWGSDVVSCAEPIMDRHCRYSHVRLIENTDARVVIHWRYALSDALYDFVALSDDGRGEWCDEFHIIYPDQVGVRKMELHFSRPERRHDWVEQIVVLPPGKYPEDVIERESISLVNMSGEVQKYSWDKEPEIPMPEPEGANMSYVHLKSTYRPFFILPPDPVETVEGTWDSPYFRSYASHMASTRYRPDPVPSAYGWWDHWPVAQIPGDGRWVITPDRPSHFNLTTFVQWKDYEYTDRKRTRIMLQGMTDKKAGELVPLARSWLHAPNMKITSESYRGGIYDQSERAYLLEAMDPTTATPCSFVLEASEDSPLINPAIIIKNWGSQPASCNINGLPLTDGKEFRQGIRKGTDGEDLILWIKLEEEKPVNIKLNK